MNLILRAIATVSFMGILAASADAQVFGRPLFQRPIFQTHFVQQLLSQPVDLSRIVPGLSFDPKEILKALGSGRTGTRLEIYVEPSVQTNLDAIETSLEETGDILARLRKKNGLDIPKKDSKKKQAGERADGPLKK